MNATAIKIVKHDNLNHEARAAVKKILQVEKDLKSNDRLGTMANLSTIGPASAIGYSIAITADHPVVAISGAVIPLIAGARVALEAGKLTEKFSNRAKTGAKEELKLLRERVKEENATGDVRATHFFIHPKTGDLHLIRATDRNGENFKPVLRNKRFAVK